MKKDNRMTVEKDSTEQAHKLTLDMFGTSEEVREMAIMEQQATSLEEAKAVLKKLVGKSLQSRSGIVATISNKTIKKITSGKATGKSFDAKAHFLAAANLEKLFANAIEPFKFSLSPKKTMKTIEM
jgi:uncharacterized protein (DUF1810 family)